MKVKCLKDVHGGISLKNGKIYDARQGKHGMFGVVDESGEEYAYPADIFEIVSVHLPLTVEYVASIGPYSLLLECFAQFDGVSEMEGLQKLKIDNHEYTVLWKTGSKVAGKLNVGVEVPSNSSIITEGMAGVLS